MSFFSSPNYLRNVLRLDALSCVGCGVVQVVFLSIAISILGISGALLLPTGIFLLVYGIAVGYLSTLKQPPRAVIWLIMLGNIGWAIGCFIVLFSATEAPSTLGKIYVVIQAVTVLVLAELQFIWLRRSNG